MHNILAVGVATIDIISIVDQYPSSNEKVRAKSRYIQRGGNACNTLVVLSQLGQNCSWLGTLAEDHFLNTVLDDLDHFHINYGEVVYHKNTSNPLSCIIVDSNSNNRSIVHYRDLPEVDINQFRRLCLSDFDCIHFEGRNITQTKLMLHAIETDNGKPLISLEVEKAHEGIAELFQYADIVMFSRDYVLSQNYVNASEFLQAHYDPEKHKALFCAWGKEGAWGIDQTGIFYSPAILVDTVIDTTGAGDVFNAGVINNMLEGKNIQDTLTSACALAALKCAQQGFDLRLEQSS